MKGLATAFNPPLPEFGKILVIRRDNIGDLLCTTPLLSALRRRYPASHIAVLANSYNAPVLYRNPDINEIYSYTKAKHADSAKWVSFWREWRLYRHLRRERFELVIHANPIPHPRTGRLVRYLNAPYRLGVDEGGRNFNVTLSPQVIPQDHHVRQVYALLAPLGIECEPGAMTLVPPEPSRDLMLRSTASRVGVHLSSRKPCNRLSVTHYSRLIEDIYKQGLEVVLFWSPGSEQSKRHPGDDEKAQVLIDRFQPGIGVYRTETLQSLIEGIAGVDLMVCPDGGALHIAAALNVPTVAIFGCTDSVTWAPWMVDHEVVCGDGEAEDIDVDDIAAAFQRLLRRYSGKRC